jgi:hypothetical protein
MKRLILALALTVSVAMPLTAEAQVYKKKIAPIANRKPVLASRRLVPSMAGAGRITVLQTTNRVLIYLREWWELLEELG